MSMNSEQFLKESKVGKCGLSQSCFTRGGNDCAELEEFVVPTHKFYLLVQYLFGQSPPPGTMDMTWGHKRKGCIRGEELVEKEWMREVAVC